MMAKQLLHLLGDAVAEVLTNTYLLALNFDYLDCIPAIAGEGLLNVAFLRRGRGSVLGFLKS